MSNFSKCPEHKDCRVFEDMHTTTYQVKSEMYIPTPTSVEEQIDELLNGDELHMIIFRRMEEMLDNPDALGIYPTSKFMMGLKTDLLALLSAERRAIYEQMLEADRDNADAGHKWSSGDWRKYVQYELAELRRGFLD